MNKLIATLILLSIPLFGCAADYSRCGNQPFPLDGKRPSQVFQNPQERELVQAALCEDEARVKQLVKQGVDIDAHGKNGVTPLILAVTQQNETAVQILLEQGANPDTPSFYPEGVRNEEVEPTAVMYAAAYGTPTIIKHLIAAGGDVNYISGETPLIIASRSASDESVRLLLEAGANPNVVIDGVMSAGTTASSMDNLEKLSVLLDHGYCAILPRVLSRLENRRDSVSKDNPKMDLLLQTINRVKTMINNGKGC